MSIRAVEISEAVERLSEYAEQIGAGPVVVTRGGQPLAVIVSAEDADMESIARLNPHFMEIIERPRARQQKEGGITSDE